MNIKQAIERLNSQLPLRQRQNQLEQELKRAHQAILRSLVNSGRPSTQVELSQILGEHNIEAGIQRLATDDLVVFDAAGKKIVGAYPVTIEKTHHHVTVYGNDIFAMCALDAVSIAPMFDTDVQINSCCHVTRSAIAIRMNRSEVLGADPFSEIRVGVRWQMPSGAAAHSMCLEMVFLVNQQGALGWQNGNTEDISLFTLPEAVEFGKGFFKPLLD